MPSLDPFQDPEQGHGDDAVWTVRTSRVDPAHEEADKTFTPCISLEAEVPEVLFDGMREFLSDHPDWDQYSVITSALAGFLFQNGCTDRCVSSFYLDGIFQLTTTEKRG